MAKGTDTGGHPKRKVGRDLYNKIKVSPSFAAEMGTMTGGIGAMVQGITMGSRVAPGAGPYVAGLGAAAFTAGMLAQTARDVNQDNRKQEGLPHIPYHQAPSSVFRRKNNPIDKAE